MICVAVKQQTGKLFTCQSEFQPMSIRAYFTIRPCLLTSGGDQRPAILSRLFVLVMLAMPTTVHAQFNYTIEHGAVTITDYSGDDTDLIIPTSLDGFPVTRIGEAAFPSKWNLTSITIPNSVVSIGNEAFNDCWNLTSVFIGSGVTFIGQHTFRGCANMALISVDVNNTTYTSEHGVLFTKDLSTLIRYPPAQIGKAYVVPHGVRFITDYALYSSPNLSSVTIPNSVTSIGNQAFAFSGLTNVTIENSAASIGDGAFQGCTSLSGVTTGNRITSIGNGAFENCSDLKHLTIPPSVTSVGGMAFRNTGLNSITIPANLELIGQSAFSSCTSLQRAYFLGNAPVLNSSDWMFHGSPVSLYYFPGTSDWVWWPGGYSAVLWNPRILTDDGNLEVQSGRLGFIIKGAADIPVAVEVCDDLANPNWTTITNLILGATGTAQFIDPEAADKPARTYRFRAE
jgi:hypothetical protein